MFTAISRQLAHRSQSCGRSSRSTRRGLMRGAARYTSGSKWWGGESASCAATRQRSQPPSMWPCRARHSGGQEEQRQSHQSRSSGKPFQGDTTRVISAAHTSVLVALSSSTRVGVATCTRTAARRFVNRGNSPAKTKTTRIRPTRKRRARSGARSRCHVITKSFRAVCRDVIICDVSEPYP